MNKGTATMTTAITAPKGIIIVTAAMATVTSAIGNNPPPPPPPPWDINNENNKFNNKINRHNCSKIGKKRNNDCNNSKPTIITQPVLLL